MTNKYNGETVKFFLEKGHLVSPDFFESDRLEINNNKLLDLIKEKIKSSDKPLIINKDFVRLINQTHLLLDINWKEFEKTKVLSEKGKDKRLYNTFLEILNYDGSEQKKKELGVILKEINQSEEESNLIIEEEKSEEESNLIILKSYNKLSKKRDPQDFVSYYNNKYEGLKKILLNRTELQNTMSISRAINKTNREEISIIGMVNEKNVSKNDNIILTLEDVTGKISVLINKSKSEIYEKAKNITLDEVIGINGIASSNIIFVNNLFFPDVPLNNTIKKSSKETYAAFISDLHVGSRLFLREEFMRFIQWLNGEYGNEQQQKISKKVKYLFIVGDLVDGVSIYPGQEPELEIKDVIEQYNECSRLLKMIRSDIKIIACGGQHDALRLSEPQPPFDKTYSKALYDLPNFYAVSNPSLMNIGSTKDFEGFNILIYHGASFHYYISNVDQLRYNNTPDNPHFVMHYLLQKRHLAPTHGSTVYVPDTQEDPLVMDKVPDIFVCGDMHRSDISQYNNVITINCSCWQSKTDFQEKVGNDPDSAKVPLFNLMSREIKILNFGD
jgi:DNA polymerase II small subunit